MAKEEKTTNAYKYIKTLWNNNNNSSSDKQFYVDFIAGGTAGAVSRTAVAPLERQKIMYMCGNKEFRQKGVQKSLRYIINNEGQKGLFRGNGANVLRIAPFMAVQFSSFQFFRKHLVNTNDTNNLHITQRFYCGVLSGILSTCVTYPLDFIRCRLSLQTEQNRIYNGIIDGLYKVINKDGFLHLYNGLLPSIIGIIPYSGIQLAVYDICRTIILKYSITKKLDTIQIFCIGSIAGATAQTVVFPIETIRRRLQISGFEQINDIDPHATKPRNNTVMYVIKDLWGQSGIRGFYRGMIPNYMKIIPAAGISFVTYEYIKDFIINN